MSRPQDRLARSQSCRSERPTRGASNHTDAIDGVNPIKVPDASTRPEFLAFIPSRITQAGPRRSLRICTLFSLIAVGLTTICVGALVTFIYPIWWLCLVAWTSSIIPLVMSLGASLSGRYAWIVGISMSCLVNVCGSIGVLSVVMTDISNAGSVWDECKNHPTSWACKSDHYEYDDFLVSHRALVTALVTIYAMACIISNGVSMVYSFFLARKCRKQPVNWLRTNIKRLSHRSSTSCGPRSTSMSSIV